MLPRVFPENCQHEVAQTRRRWRKGVHHDPSFGNSHSHSQQLRILHQKPTDRTVLLKGWCRYWQKSQLGWKRHLPVRN